MHLPPIAGRAQAAPAVSSVRLRAVTESSRMTRGVPQVGQRTSES